MAIVKGLVENLIIRRLRWELVEVDLYKSKTQIIRDMQSVTFVVTYLEVPLTEFLFVKLGERNCTCSSILVIALIGHVRDEGADVFFELGQISHDVVLSEHNTIIVVHLCGHREEELRRHKGLNHNLDRLLDLSKHLLCLQHLVVPI